MRYDSTIPAFPLRNRWACCPTAARWALATLGVGLQEGYLESGLMDVGALEMIDGLGMVDKTGLELTGYLNEAMGIFGVQVDYEAGADFAAVLRRAGNWPLVAYGEGWSHWTGIRGSDPDRGVLVLANSADPMRREPRQLLTADDWHDLGPFNVVELRR